ncbi:MAG: glycosyltransferase [Candidatus Neomarinimicrobiota bacterium]
MPTPAVSVLIVSFNVRQYLDQALRAVHKSDFAGSLEIIVTENNSFDGTADFLKKNYPDVSLITNAVNAGFGRAVNQAARRAAGNYFLILNPDTIIQESTIAVLVDYLETNPTVGMIGPKILTADGSLQPACKRSFPSLGVALPKALGLNRLFPRSQWANRYNLTYLDPDQVHRVDAISGSCMFIRADLFRTLDGFDERFFMFGEDLDLCYRVNEAGYEVHYVPATQIIHYQGESVKSAPYDSLNAFYNAMILFADKHFSRGQGILMRLGIRLGIYLRKSLAQVASRRSQIISIILDGLVVTAAFLIAIPLKFGDYQPITASHGLVPAVYIVFWLIVGSVFQLYSRFNLSYSRAILSSFTGFLIAVTFTYFFKQYAFSRLIILVASSIISLLLPGWRILIHYLISRGVFRSVHNHRDLLFARKTLIIGSDAESARIADRLIKRFDTGLELVGFCDDRVDDPERLPLPFLGTLTDLRDIVRTKGIGEVIFSTGKFTNEAILRIMVQTKDLHLIYRMVPQKQDILLGKALVEEIGDFSFININYPLYNRLNKISKRLFDLIGSTILLVPAAPVIFLKKLAGAGKKIEFWGPDGTKFQAGMLVSGNRFIARLPLLWQIIVGKMSFVGATLVQTSATDPGIMFRPGLTGLDRIRKIPYSTEDRRLLDHYYVQHQNFTLDLEIILKSVFGG